MTIKELVIAAEWPRTEEAGGVTLDLSRDEQRVAAEFWPRRDSSVAHNKVLIYDVAATPKLTGELQVAWTHGGDATAVRFAPDSRRFVVAGKTTTIVDASSRETIEIPLRSTHAVLFADSNRVAMCESSTLTIWDLALGAASKTLRGKTSGPGGGSLYRCAVSADGNWIVTADSNNNTLLWSTTTDKSKKLNKSRAPTGPYVMFDPRGGILFGPDKTDAGVVATFRAVDAPTKPVLEIPLEFPYQTTMVDIHMSADGAHYATTRWNGDRSAIDVYSVTTRERIATASGDERDRFWSARLFDDGRVLATTGTGRILQLA